MKNIDVIIFYEHVNREYESVNELKKTLSLKGVTSIIIPVHYNKYINLFNENQLLELDKFLNFEDELILNFYHHNIIEKQIDKNKVSIIFKDFKL